MIDMIDILNGGHVLIAGQTGSGKSVLVNNLLYHLITNFDSNQARLILCDPKRVELVQYANTAFCDTYASESSTIISALDRAINIMESRYRAMQESRERKYNGCTIYVVIDELADLMTTCKKDVLPRLQRIAQLGRAARVFLIACTQAPSRKVIPAELTLNFNTKIALHCATAIESKQVIGAPGAETLPRYGHALVNNAEGTERIDVPMIDDSDIEDALEPFVLSAPSASSASSASSSASPVYHFKRRRYFTFSKPNKLQSAILIIVSIAIYSFTQLA